MSYNAKLPSKMKLQKKIKEETIKVMRGKGNEALLMNLKKQLKELK